MPILYRPDRKPSAGSWLSKGGSDETSCVRGGLPGNHPCSPKETRYLNEVDRHYEQSELTEGSLYERAVHRPDTVEESAMRRMEYQQLHKAISELPETQRRRLCLYYFEGLTYEQIGELEGCTFQAVAKSIVAAEKRLKNILK